MTASGYEAPKRKRGEAARDPLGHIPSLPTMYWLPLANHVLGMGVPEPPSSLGRMHLKGNLITAMVPSRIMPQLVVWHRPSQGLTISATVVQAIVSTREEAEVRDMAAAVGDRGR
jgi:hypothetical protein